MPIDLMSPVQALESAAMKLTAMKEAKEYKAMQAERQAKADARAEAKEARDVEMHEAKINKVNAQTQAIQNKEAREDEKLEILHQRADAETSTAEAYKKSVNKQLTPKQKIEIARIDLNKENSITRREKYKSEKNKQNSSKFSQKAEDFKNEQIDAIYNNQVNLGGE